MTEIFWQPDGLPGQALKIMRENGWAMIGDFTNLNQVMTNDKQLSIKCEMKFQLFKNGLLKTQDEWNAELLEVWNELTEGNENVKGDKDGSN